MVNSISCHANPAINFIEQSTEKVSLNTAQQGAGQIAINLQIEDWAGVFQGLCKIGEYLHENFEIDGSPMNLPQDTDLNFIATWMLTFSNRYYPAEKEKFQCFIDHLSYDPKDPFSSDVINSLSQSSLFSPSRTIFIQSLYNFSTNESCSQKKMEFSGEYEKLLNLYINMFTTCIARFLFSSHDPEKYLTPGNKETDNNALDIMKNYISWYSTNVDAGLTHLYSLGVNTDAFYKALLEYIKSHKFEAPEGALKA